MLVNKKLAWRALVPFLYMNARPEVYHAVTVPNTVGRGDKETLPVAMRVLGCVPRIYYF